MPDTFTMTVPGVDYAAMRRAFPAVATAVPGAAMEDRSADFGGAFAAVVTFPNGRGASVVSHVGSYGGRDGRYEVAVLDTHGELDYTTEVTGDVEGWLTLTGVRTILGKIASL